MARPDMVFTLAEVDAAERAAGRRPRSGPAPTGPDMVFTESEVYGAERPSTLTREERDRARRPPTTSAERAEALRGAPRSRLHEVASGIGTVNDGISVATGVMSAVEPADPLSDVIGGVGNTVAGVCEIGDAVSTLTDSEASDEERREARWGAGIGVADTLSGIAGMAGYGVPANVLGGVSGAVEVGAGVDAIMSGGDEAAGWQQVLHGGLAGGSSVAPLLGPEAAFAAPVLSAGAAGVAGGTWVGDRSDAVSLEEGRYTERRMAGRGVDAPMEDYNVSASEEASIRGCEDAAWVRDATGSELAGDIAGGISTIGRSWYNGFTNLW